MKEHKQQQHVETLNTKAEQVAFIGRAMERAELSCTLSDFLMMAAVNWAEEIIGSPAPGKEVAV